MTERHAGYLVTLEHDMREDDAESTIAALRHIRGVLSVTPVTAGSSEYYIGAARTLEDVRKKVLELLRSLHA